MDFTLLLKALVAAIILATGMRSSLSDLTYLWRRPGLLLRSLLAMYLVVPLMALVLVRILPLSPALEAVLLVFAVSAGAPLLPRRLTDFGDGAYVFSLVATSTLLSIVVVPVAVTILVEQHTGHADINTRQLAITFGQWFFLPLCIGLLVRWIIPNHADRLADKLVTFGMIALLACAIVMLYRYWSILISLRIQGVLVLSMLIALALTVGHLLGGPEEDDRTTLAMACATRHAGVGILVAASYPGPVTAVLLLAYLLTSAVVTVPYLRWRRKSQPKQQAS